MSILHVQIDKRILEANEDNYGFDPFNLGFVRTIVMRFSKGDTNLKTEWEKEYNETLANTTTANATNLEQVLITEIFELLLNLAKLLALKRE